MIRNTYLLLLAFIMIKCVPIAETSSSSRPAPNKKLIFQDYRYEENIRSDRLYPGLGFAQDIVQSSAVALDGETRLILEFDELYSDYQDYSVKLIHCNYDWTKSMLTDLDFSVEYNEYPIRDYQYSQGSRIPYTHYAFIVPKVKIPGNYLLVVSREPNSQDYVLTRRFIVFDNRVQVTPTINVMTGATGRFQNHQIEFSVNHRGIDIRNPYSDIKVMIRQNQRWDNAITNLNPTQIRQDKSLLEYRHFTGQNTFVALNEFRFIDLRSTNFRGQNIARIEKSADSISAYAVIDKQRGSPYSQYADLNGNYVIENNDPGADFMEEDYIESHFFLETAQISTPIYVIGTFNNWRRNNENLLRYDNERQLYTTSILLKQGFYNYLYYIDGGAPDPYSFEGAFFESENEYEIIVYHRPSGTFADLIVGYRNFNSRN